MTLSRTLHTAPLRVRAVARVQDPFAPRGRGDARRDRAARRELKACGLVPVRALELPARPERLPRVTLRPPRPAHVHAVTRADVVQALELLGPDVFYGVRSVELARGSRASLELGRYTPIGQIQLLDVPIPPWRLRLTAASIERLTRAGAALTDLGAHVREVAWSAGALRSFFLFDVLPHELGHHLLQHHRGKRPARIARTCDHEAVAALLAARLRRLLEGTA